MIWQDFEYACKHTHRARVKDEAQKTLLIARCAQITCGNIECAIQSARNAGFLGPDEQVVWAHEIYKKFAAERVSATEKTKELDEILANRESSFWIDRNYKLSLLEFLPNSKTEEVPEPGKRLRNKK